MISQFELIWFLKDHCDTNDNKNNQIQFTLTNFVQQTGCWNKVNRIGNINYIIELQADFIWTHCTLTYKLEKKTIQLIVKLGLLKGFELSNTREYFYNIGNIHMELPSTPTLMVTLVLQLLQLRTTAAGWRPLSPP